MLENSEELTNKIRGLLELRMSLIPHLYTAFCEYECHGIPPIRPLVLDYSEDVNVRDMWDEFILGEGLLAAPVIFEHPGQVGRNVYLPDGVWYDFYTNERLEGGRSYFRQAPPECLPLFVKEGALIALADPLEYMGDNPVFDITLKLYGEEATCKLYTGGATISAPLNSVIASKAGIPENSRYRCKAVTLMV